MTSDQFLDLFLLGLLIVGIGALALACINDAQRPKDSHDDDMHAG